VWGWCGRMRRHATHWRRGWRRCGAGVWLFRWGPCRRRWRGWNETPPRCCWSIWACRAAKRWRSCAQQATTGLAAWRSRSVTTTLPCKACGFPSLRPGGKLALVRQQKLVSPPARPSRALQRRRLPLAATQVAALRRLSAEASAAGRARSSSLRPLSRSTSFQQAAARHPGVRRWLRAAVSTKTCVLRSISTFSGVAGGLVARRSWHAQGFRDQPDLEPPRCRRVRAALRPPSGWRR
jgi:hypothetical protein